MAKKNNRTAQRNRGESASDMEAELKKSRAVISFMGDGLLLVDRKFKVTMANEAAAVLLREAPGELMGKKLDKVLRLESEGQKFDLDKLILDKVLSANDILRFGYEKKIFCLDKENNSFPVSFTISPFAIDEMSGVVIIFRDSSRELELEESKDNFISITSHQLRTPLTSIRWNAELLNETMTEQGDRKEFVEQIYQGALRLNETINLILSLSRSEKGRVSEQIELMDPTRVTEEVVKGLKPNLIEKKQQINLTVENNIVDFLFPVPKLRLVLNNLINNAITYTKEGGTIEVYFKKDLEGLVCSVKDNGIGIPRTKQHKVFQKFFRAQNALKMSPDGSGLSLALSKALVNSWGGNIWFNSKENEGTTFFFSIPLHGANINGDPKL